MNSPTKSFFKKLFLGDSQLGYKFQKMTKRNGVLKGLKDQEYKCGNCANQPPFPLYLSWTKFKRLQAPKQD
jgi:hypothetical protein